MEDDARRVSSKRSNTKRLNTKKVAKPSRSIGSIAGSLKAIRAKSSQAALKAQGGIIADYLRRDVAAGQALGSNACKFLVESDDDGVYEPSDKDDASEDTKAPRRGIFADRSGWRRARQIVYFESLVQQLTGVIAGFWLDLLSEEERAIKKVVNYQTVIEKAGEIVRLGRARHCLKMEVGFQVALRHLLHGPRLEEFKSKSSDGQDNKGPDSDEKKTFWKLFRQDDCKRSMGSRGHVDTGGKKDLTRALLETPGAQALRACSTPVEVHRRTKSKEGRVDTPAWSPWTDFKLLEGKSSPRSPRTEHNEGGLAISARATSALRKVRHRQEVHEQRQQQLHLLPISEFPEFSASSKESTLTWGKDTVETISGLGSTLDLRGLSAGDERPQRLRLSAGAASFLQPTRMAVTDDEWYQPPRKLPSISSPGMFGGSSSSSSSRKWASASHSSWKGSRSDGEPPLSVNPLSAVSSNALSSFNALKAAQPRKGMGKIASAPLLRRSRVSFAHILGSTGASHKLPAVASLAGPFINPWHLEPRTERGLLEPEAHSESATMKYIGVCRAVGVVPSSAALEMAHSRSILSPGSMTDSELIALAAMVRRMDSLKEVSLPGCGKLSDKALKDFLRKLFGRPAMSTLLRLDLKNCKGAGRLAMNTMVQLLSEPKGIYRLSHLDLSGIQISIASLSALCPAIQGHTALRFVHLADTSIGLHPTAPSRLCEVLGAPALEVLSLGWNCFSEAAFSALGNAVYGHRTLKELSLVNCDSRRTPVGEAPISIFLEGLSRNKSLKILDISMNRIGTSGALVLEDSLESHHSLSDLFIGQNPLGVRGIRSIVRLMSRNTSGLLRFESSNCNDTASNGGFNATEPTGRYKLDLGLAHGRALLRLLYKTCERFKLSFSQAFLELEYEPTAGSLGSAPYRHPSEKDRDAVYVVPAVGFLSFAFSIDAALLKIVEPVSASSKPSALANGYLERRFALVRLRPHFRKVAPLLAQFRSLTGRAAEQEMLLAALSSDFSFDFEFLAQLCEDSCSSTDVLCRLLHCVARRPTHLFMALTYLPRIREYLKVYSSCERLLLLNVENPTGRYMLNLQAPSDYAVAETLLLLDRWEAMMAQSEGRHDLSMYGNWSSVRNCTYQNATIRSVAEWIMPNIDVVTFDYASWRRPPAGAQPLDLGRWETIMTMLGQSALCSESKVQVLRHVSGQCYLRALQVRDLLAVFETSELRVKAMSLFVLRVTDPQNMKAVRTRVGASEEWEALRHRLGVVTLYPFFQPEQTRFDLDLELYEDRIAASLAVRSLWKENLRNIREPKLVLPDRSEFVFVQGVPQKWENPEQLPKAGIFTFHYACSAEDRKLEDRKDMATKYGGWKVQKVTSEKILWWTAIIEVPQAVITFLCYVMRSFNWDIWACFKFIDGSGNREISLSEFKTGVTKLGWPLFVQDPEKAVQVFRWMDPDSGGSISKPEWKILDQLFEELQLAMLELLQYIHRVFGSLEAAWEELDTDAGGTVDLEEWQEAMITLGYHGPINIIYEYLSIDDESPISRERWDTLSELWSNRETLYKELFRD